MARPERRGVVAWALYDWANSAFATSVMAGFFPLFFKQYWSGEASAADSTFRLGVANSLASAVVVVLAPVLGAIADAGALQKRLLAVLCALGVLSTGALYFVSRGDWLGAALLYGLGSVGFMGGNALYDSLIVSVARPERRDVVSGLGYALGYLGGGLLFLVNVLVVLHPRTFGLPDAESAIRLAFASVAVWWAVFALPLFFRVAEPAPERRAARARAIAEGFARLRRTLSEIRGQRVLFQFLIAYWLYIDGVDTIIRMAVDYGLAIGLDANDLIVALLVTQFVGFPAALAFGKLGERIGAKRGILIGLGVYALITIWAAVMRTAFEFYALAAVVGLVQGGVQALSRSLFSRMVPAERASELFGFYNVLGKFAAVVGPLLVGATSALTGEPRLSIGVVLVLFAAGGILLWRTDVAAGELAARVREQAGDQDFQGSGGLDSRGSNGSSGG